jgi:nucleotide-binding universal stress UspA family protein
MESKTTLLVTTDFSSNSKAGIRFAIQLAVQTGCHLVFYHVIDRLTPTMWTKDAADAYAEKEIEKTTLELGRFLKRLYAQAKIAMPDYKYVVEMGLNIDSFIIHYAQHIKADYICMSTHGAGVLKKIVGTNASTLVSESPIPVIVVPHKYRVKPLNKVGYASDFEHIDKELAIVKNFAAPLQADISVYHYHYYFHEKDSKALFKKIIEKYQSPNVSFHIPKLYIDYSLIENLKQTVEKERLSILIMFTKQKENWFQRFFLESKTVDMTYDIKVPLLAIKK